jgi:hypothetical protein
MISSEYTVPTALQPKRVRSLITQQPAHKEKPRYSNASLTTGLAHKPMSKIPSYSRELLANGLALFSAAIGYKVKAKHFERALWPDDRDGT